MCVFDPFMLAPFLDSKQQHRWSVGMTRERHHGDQDLAA